MKSVLRLFFTLTLLILLTQYSYALDIPDTLVLKSDATLWTIKPKTADFYSDYNKTFFKNIEVKPLPDEMPLVEGYLDQGEVEGVDVMKIRQYLESKIAPAIFREREDVTIDMDEFGKVIFEGHGLYGRSLDIEKTAIMIKNALENGIDFLTLPIIREDPDVTVLSDALKQMGIIELFSAGETDFSGSPYNRINNINVGLSKFSGHIIKPNEEFVFGNVLGSVGPETGFKQELVIKGDRTVPEYGGGLCQVSTTTYRAVLAGGFPVTERKNHSYAVSYYAPHGLDATVYPPSPDLKFINDSPAHILMQAFTIGNHAYYNFYGTKDDREVYMIGPYYSGWKSAPPKKTEYSEKLAPGEVQVIGHAVPGLNASWYRQVIHNGSSEDPANFLELIFSNYQARPEFYLVGEKPLTDLSENGY
jgi:vancomycin resistance protein YoaR